MIKKTVVIIGAGPAGLSTGFHLKKQGFNDFLILEKKSYPGGLAASFKDKKGFIWDVGGHIIHEKNQEFVNFAKEILNNQLYQHKRKAFIYFKKHLIPYPFQNNIAFLPEKYKKECLRSLLKTNSLKLTPRNFHSWILANFGEGIAKYFMVPQNKKSWQYSLKKISTVWLKKRVSLPPLEAIKKECQKKYPKEISWGSHKEFYYPKKAGIGSLWKKAAELLKAHVLFNNIVKKVDLPEKLIFVGGKKIVFKHLISTIPLNELIKISNAPEKVKNLALHLEHNSGLIIGLGFDKKPIDNNWHWIYFPNKTFTFFRLIFLSNLSKNTIPKPNFSSFLAEISWRKRRLDKAKIIAQTSKQIGKLFFKNENIKPVSIFSLFVPYYYPIPTLNRDKSLKEIDKFLKKQQVYSLGRFGSWQYEKGNMDDCFEQGRKIINSFMKINFVQ